MLKTVSTANGLVSPTFSGNVTLSDGNLIIGTAGKGIDFSADPSAAGMTSELLDDYEEGTWTPSVGGTATYTSRSGKYTKIGRQVTITFEMTINVLGTGSTARISGLPFTATDQSAGVIGYYGNLALARRIGGFYTVGTDLRNYEITSAATRLTDQAILGNGTRIDSCTITYFV